MSNVVKYSIGIDPLSKNSTKLHLWRQEKSQIWKVASFKSIQMADKFAKEFDFPLSDSTKQIILMDKNNGN